LGGVARLGIAELDVMGDVVGGKVGVPGSAGHRQAAVGEDGVESEGVAVSDHVVSAGDQGAIVLAITVAPAGRS
jgi:hypothetical protein